MKTTGTSYKRDTYNAIITSSVNTTTMKQVRRLFEEVQKSEKVDEHGSWNIGSDFNYKGVGYAINYDYYAIGRDFFTKRLMFIVQVRKFVRHRANYFANIQKSYFLCGRNEDNSAFAHPVESRVIHSAIAKGSDVIRAVQNWIFGTDYTKVIRQGDLCFVPLKRKPTADNQLGNHIVLQSSHELHAMQIVAKEGNIYAQNPELFHLGGVHPALYEEGWYKIIVGKRGSYYSFATPTVD